MNNSKPRLCGVLGVGINQRFKLNVCDEYTIMNNTVPFGEFYVDKDGCINGVQDNSATNCLSALLEAIYDPDCVEPFKVDNWKYEDVEDAQAILKVFPNAYYIKRNKDNAVEITNYYDEYLCTLRSGLVARLPKGYTVIIREIIDSKGEQNETRS